MTKIEDTAPVNTSCATGHNHQLSETARENTSNQAYLTSGTKKQSSNWNASYKIITCKVPEKSCGYTHACKKILSKGTQTL